MRSNFGEENEIRKLKDGPGEVHWKKKRQKNVYLTKERQKIRKGWDKKKTEFVKKINI